MAEKEKISSVTEEQPIDPTWLLLQMLAALEGDMKEEALVERHYKFIPASQFYADLTDSDASVKLPDVRVLTSFTVTPLSEEEKTEPRTFHFPSPVFMDGN
ncbi:MAG: hypothetical protein OQJ98_02195 [Candidatus Pacebacteria bacterium]|nr:hypothetical protein [Candidatus Paceibacterota bacterium]